MSAIYAYDKCEFVLRQYECKQCIDKNTKLFFLAKSINCLKFVNLFILTLFLIFFVQFLTLAHANNLTDEELRQRNEELESVLDAIPALVWIAKDPKCQVITGNRYVNDMFGVTNDTNVSQTAAEKGQGKKIIHLKPDGTEFSAGELPMQQSIARGEAVRNVEFSYLFPDGHQVYVIGNAVPLFDKNGSIRGAVGAFIDVTKSTKASIRLYKQTQIFMIAAIGFIVMMGIMIIVLTRMWQISKKNESALRRSEERFRSLFEVSRDGFVFVNASGAFIDANPAYCDMLGYSLDELCHMKDFYRITPEKWRQWEAEEIWEKRLIKEGHSGLYEKEYIRKDGSVFPVELNSFTVRNQDNKIEYLWGIARDITERKKAEQKMNEMETEIQRSQKLESIGLLAGGIAHDFNNMLGVIAGNISYILSSIDQHDENRDVFEDIQTGTKQAQKLTQQLLTFAKGGAPVKKEADIRNVLQESAIFVSRGSKARCEFEFDENLWIVAVDNGQMNQAVSNLVINAKQAMPDGGVIHIKAENKKICSDNRMLLPAGNYVKISIKDNGIGIAENHISKIFDPYFTTKQQGRGLGLSSTYSIIKAHYGNISVESKIEEGTTFYIYIPATDTKITMNQKKKPIIYNKYGKILIMDDQVMILKMAERLFRRIGYETICSENGDQAIQVFREAFQNNKPFDLVILDITIPGGIGGAEVIVELLKIDPNVKAVVSSGYSNDPIMANYKDYGFCGVMPKPITIDELKEMLSQVFT